MPHILAGIPISAAATALGVSQPAVSRRLFELEKTVGRSLVVRSSRSVVLTEAGALLRERARTILNLADDAVDELSPSSNEIVGEIRIGAAETTAFRRLVGVVARLRAAHPRIGFSVHSGGGPTVERGMERGDFTFGLFIQPWELGKYETIQLPEVDRWGVLVRRDSPLSRRDSLALADLEGVPVLAPERVVTPTGVSQWLGTGPDLDVRGTFNLAYNAALMVLEGLGAAIVIDGIIPAGPTSSTGLRFIPFAPSITSRLHLAWSPEHRLTPVERLFVDALADDVRRFSGTKQVD